jgi:large subunit ribosomal protein L22
MARARTQPVEEPQEVRASAQYLRVTPRKARLVVDHIRGRSVPEARTVLAFTPRAAAREIEKVLASAVANAEANHGLIGDELIVSAAYVDEGPVIKRWRARARGRVARIRKRTCHVTLRLTPIETDGEVRRPRRAQAAAVEAPGETTEEPAVEETPAEEKPKRARRPAARKPAASKRKTSTKGKEDEETAEKPKPRARRAPRKKPEESEES